MDLSKGHIKVETVAKIIGIISAAIIFSYSTFATISYVDQKHTSVLEVLNDIKLRLIRIEDKQDKLIRRTDDGE